MKKALMIMAMVAVIGLAGANSAMANWFFPYGGTDKNFFDSGTWFFFAPGGPQGGVVPGTGVDPHAIKPGGYGTATGSLLYDPANQSPGDMVYSIGDLAEQWGQPHTIGSYNAANIPWTFRQESGDLTFGAPNSFAVYVGTYVMNAGEATFGKHLEIWNPTWTAPVSNLFDQNGGDVVVQGTGLHIGDISGGGAGTAVYTIADGTCQTESLTIGANSALNFDAASTGVVYVNTSDKTEAGIEALITAGDITLGGAAAVLADFEITEGMGPGGAYTEVKLAGGGGAPIPEPAGLGLIGLALLAVRKRRS